MSTNKALLILLMAFLLLASCNQSFPDEMPDIGLNIDQLDFNQSIKLTTPKSCNSYKSGEDVCVQVANLSDKMWQYNIDKDIFIFAVENQEWEKVSDKLISLGDVDYVLKPKGQFPFDGHVFPLKPDVHSSQSHYLRIIILVHEKTDDKPGQTAGAYVDVVLRK